VTDDEYFRRRVAVVRVTARNIARVLHMTFTPEQSKAVREAIDDGLHRWLENEEEMSVADDDDENPNLPSIDDRS
jgi:hypothetical protein